MPARRDVAMMLTAPELNVAINIVVGGNEGSVTLRLNGLLKVQTIKLVQKLKVIE